MIPVITAIDAAYWPGLKALARSFKANAGPGFELHCIVYGDAELRRRVSEICIAVDPPEWNTLYPTTAKWPVPLAAMYARLLIPELFKQHDRAIWLDADCIVLDDLAELAAMTFDQPMAGVNFDTRNYTLGFHIPNLRGVDPATPVPFTGIMVFNIPEWRRLDITAHCTEWMNADCGFDFRFVVQSVLGLVLQGNYHHLEYRWNVFGGRRDPIPDNAKIVHYVGALPWRDEMPHRRLWEQYA